MWRHNVISLQCDAAHLPLEDASVDLIVTSPPYFSLRTYQEGGKPLEGQLGNEPTPQEFLKALITCTEEWMRVLKPRGSIFVNLGDKYAGGGGGPAGRNKAVAGGDPFPVGRGTIVNNGATWGFRNKSLMGIPWRYALGCIDDLGLILREEVIWHKTNGLPESVRDRCRRSHEQVFHFTKEPDYYSAVVRIREDHARDWSGGAGGGKSSRRRVQPGEKDWNLAEARPNHLGKLPDSVWSIPLAPLLVPKYLAEESLDGSEFNFDHYAAFPPDLPQKIIMGYSPKDVCTKCGQGRFPVSEMEYEWHYDRGDDAQDRQARAAEHGRSGVGACQTFEGSAEHRIIGNACACTPYTDHPENRGKDWRAAAYMDDRAKFGNQPSRENAAQFGEGRAPRQARQGDWTDGGRYRNQETVTGGKWTSTTDLESARRRDEYGRLPTREYLLDQWEAPPSVPGVVLDPCGGTGTTAITAARMSRRGITCDLSYDYAKRLVEWRMYDLSQNRRKK